MKKDLNLPCGEIQFTANIFYRLLLSNMRNPRLPGDNYKGNTDKPTETHMFMDINALVNTRKAQILEFKSVYDNKGGTLALNGSYKNAASKFKSGKITSRKSTIYVLNDMEFVGQFDDQVKNAYSAALTKTVAFARRYFECQESADNTDLIKKVLFLILSDDSINDSQKFYICFDGSTKTKADLRNIEKIEFEAFLLGVLHFLIVSQRLRVDLKKVDKIIVDIGYKKKNIKLLYSNIEVTPTVTSGDSDTQNQTDSNNNRKETDVSEEQSTEETRSIREKAAGHVASEFETQVDERDFNIISVLENNEIRLSRSIYFYLMENCRQTVHPKRDKNAVERLFLDLLHLTGCDNCSLKPDRGLTRYYPDKFRQLKMRSSAYCLDDESLINSFSAKMLNDYGAVLSDMIKIRKKYFNSDEKNESLVVALIEFIRNDNSIDNRQEFLVCSDGTALTKAQLCEVEEIEFEPFLLGVWHYVLTQYRAKDSADEKTYDTVFRTGYKPPDEDSVLYRTADLIAEQSELYVELIYIEE